MPSNKLSISTCADVDDDNCLLTRSHSDFKRRIALFDSFKSLRCFLLNSCVKKVTKRLSKSSPPKCVSPAVALTSKIPSSIESKLQSKVPPPQSNTRICFSFLQFLSKPYAIAAAVGSLIILVIFNPEIVPASFVD